MQRGEVEALIRRSLKKYATRDEITNVGPFTSNRAIASDDGGNLTEVSVTRTELGHLDNVSSNIQTQFINKLDANVVNAYSQGLLSKNSQSTAHTYLGLGTAATASSGSFISDGSTFASDLTVNLPHLKLNSSNSWDDDVGGLMIESDDIGTLCLSGAHIFRRDGNVTNGFHINRHGYNGGTGQYRELYIGTGKGYYVAEFKGNNRYFRCFNTSNGITLEVRGNESKLYFNGSLKHGSDDRIKHNEEPLVDALGTIKKLQVRKYLKSGQMYAADHSLGTDTDGNYTGLVEGDAVQPEIGIIAQQVETIPELAFCVDTVDDEPNVPPRPKHLDYNCLFTLNIQATQELRP